MFRPSPRISAALGGLGACARGCAMITAGQLLGTYLKHKYSWHRETGISPTKRVEVGITDRDCIFSKPPPSATRPPLRRAGEQFTTSGTRFHSIDRPTFWPAGNAGAFTASIRSERSCFCTTANCPHRMQRGIRRQGFAFSRKQRESEGNT